MRFRSPLLITILAAALFLAACRADGQFGPLYPTSTPGGVFVGQPVTVTFPELQNNPFALRNRTIQTTGRFTRRPVEACLRYRGPQPAWGLIADGLRMDVVGLETVAAYLPEDLSVTVEGIWRLYSGPLGCGKLPPHGDVWYLQLLQVIQPNPLPLTGLASGQDGGGLPIVLPTATPAGGIEPVATPPLIGPPPTMPPPFTMTPPRTTPTPTPPGGATPAATPSRTPTVTPSGTPAPGATIPPLITPTNDPTATPSQIPPSPTPTATSSGYIPPPPPPTATPRGY